MSAAEATSTILLDPSEIVVGERFRRDLGALYSLKESISEVGLLQPIGVSKDKRLVFGERRLKACIELGYRKVTCVVVDGDYYRLKVAELHENVRRKEMTWDEQVLAIEELKQMYEKLYGWTKQGERTDLTLLSDGKVNQIKFGKELNFSRQKVSQDLQLAAALKKYPAVAKAKTKRQALQKLRKIRILEKSETDCEPDDQALMVRLDYPPRPYDVWNFPDLDDRFGKTCAGNIPAGLVFNLLYFFTSRGDLVVDPMAGGGVVGDVCKAMGRRCLMYDLKPSRPDIERHDLMRQGWPSDARKSDLVFLDPPYYKKREDDYGTDSISSLDRGEYLEFFGKLAENIHKSNAEKVAFFMSDYTDDEDAEQNIFIWHYVALFKNAGWTPERHIMAPLSTEQIHPDFIIKFRETRRLGRLGRSLVVFKRGG